MKEIDWERDTCVTEAKRKKSLLVSSMCIQRSLAAGVYSGWGLKCLLALNLCFYNLLLQGLFKELILLLAGEWSAIKPYFKNNSNYLRFLMAFFEP